MNISVAMATYNGERFLRAQLDSLASQSLQPLELVVCDDGSSDRTPDIIADFAAAAPFPVRWHRNEERLGYGDNFLKAARLCRGELIAFCDQDDVWQETKLARCAAEFADPSVLQVVHSARVVDADLKPTGARCPAFGTVRSLAPLTMDPWYTPFGFAMMFSARLLPFFRDPRPNTYYAPVPQAHDQWVYFLATALGRSVFLPELLAQYRQHGANATGAAVGDLKDVVRMAAQAGGGQYQMLATVAAGYVDCLRDLALRHEEHADALARAADYYGDLARTYQRRVRLYRETPGRIARASCLYQLIRDRGYRSRGSGGLGVRALVKDTVFALARP